MSYRDIISVNNWKADSLIEPWSLKRSLLVPFSDERLALKMSALNVGNQSSPFQLVNQWNLSSLTLLITVWNNLELLKVQLEKEQKYVHLFYQPQTLVFIKKYCKGETICMKWSKMRQMSIPYNALSRHNKQWWMSASALALKICKIDKQNSHPQTSAEQAIANIWWLKLISKHMEGQVPVATKQVMNICQEDHLTHWLKINLTLKTGGM